MRKATAAVVVPGAVAAAAAVAAVVKVGEEAEAEVEAVVAVAEEEEVEEEVVEEVEGALGGRPPPPLASPPLEAHPRSMRTLVTYFRHSTRNLICKVGARVFCGRRRVGSAWFTALMDGGLTG
ncbi:hypothetical protein E2C01_096531 [Portunus trituberculatus]|uniref:Secreted protein n=1 Tax=Portunus trituberculatus TaxID=210409 RepID=A0A5B7JVV3_PORTR|nr:hypothetical protein [Portunus trituberculatus]